MERTSVAPLVLVADNDPGIRTLIVEVLRKLRVGMLVVGDGRAAVRLVQEHRAKLCYAVLDLRMPVLDGLGTARAIREIAPRLPIVMMSSYFPRSYWQQIEPLRIAHVLEKPFRLDELCDVVGRVSVAGTLPEGHYEPGVQPGVHGEGPAAPD